MVSTLDLAWAAGFLEGEGCFTPAAVYPRVAASQVQLEPLTRLQRIFGGSIQDYRTKSGQINTWTAQGITAREVMMTIYVLMSPKRRTSIRNSLAVWRELRGKGSYNAQKTHCPQGHAYDEANTHIYRYGQKRERVARQCKACIALRKEAI